MKLESIEDATEQLERIISIYNGYRLHSSLDMHTPDFAHSQTGAFKKRWKTYYKTKPKENKEVATLQNGEGI